MVFSYRSLSHAGKAYKVSQSPVIPLISGEWIVSDMWHEILRLSPQLFWLGLFTHRAFSSAQDDDTGGSGRVFIWEIRCVFWNYRCYIRYESALREGPRRRRRMDPRSGVKNYVRLPVSLKRHPDRSGGILPADR